MKTKSKHYKNRMFFNECTGVSVCEIINPAQSFSFSCAYRGIFQFLQNGNFQFWCSYVWGILQPYKLITDTERDVESKRKRPLKYQGIPKPKSGLSTPFNNSEETYSELDKTAKKKPHFMLPKEQPMRTVFPKADRSVVPFA